MKKFLLILVLVLMVFLVRETYMNLLPLSDVLPLMADSSGTPAEPENPEPTPTSPPAPGGDSVPEPTPAPTPTPTPTPAPTSTPAPETKGDSYYITVNVEANTITVYTLDENGYYSIPYRAMICSTGSDTPTSGVYTLGEQHRWHYLFGDVFGQYTTQITGNILFHSVPYTVYGDPGSLEYWEFDKLGTSCSMGCIRLQVEDAKWIYDNYSRITAVQFYTDPDPGPLGKPTAPLISDNEQCRGWDPTDPDPGNPWLNTPAEEQDSANIAVTG